MYQIHIKRTISKLLYFSAIAFAMPLTSCSDYLDVVPKNDVETIDTKFEQRQDVYNWLQSCYAMLTQPTTSFILQPGYVGADEFVAGQYIREIKWYNQDPLSGFFIGDGLQKKSNPYCSIWKNTEAYAAIRYCNIFIQKVDQCYNMTADEKQLWKAEVQACKANFYFELMKRYGPIILVPENIDTNADIKMMQQPRQPIDSCVNAIVKLCDEAMEHLPYQSQKESTRVTYYNKEAAATLKAYALLYAASPLYNGNMQLKDFKNKNGVRLFPDYDKEKWHKAALAADEAIEICKNAGKELYSGTSDQGSELLNTIADVQQSVLDLNYSNKESLLAFRPQRNSGSDGGYSFLLTAFNDKATDYYDWQVKNGGSGIAPSMKMVEMFYTDHGLPITEDKQWMASPYQLSKEADSRYTNVLPLNEDILSLHRHREPRFYADIVADRTYWYRKMMQNGKLVDKAILVKCYRNETFGTDEKTITSQTAQSLTGYWCKKHIMPCIPLKNYTGSLGEAELPCVLFRLAELYLMSAEAWNEYLDEPNQHVYDMLDVVRKRAGIPGVVEAWTTYSKNPQKVKTQSGMREIIHREWNIEFAFEGRRYYNLRRWMEAPEELNQPQYGWNILADNQQGFYNNFEGPKVVWSKRKFTAPRDYFIPINSEEILISGCVQNPGW